MIHSVGGESTPSYVLMCENEQVGAVDGSLGIVAGLTIFDPYRGMKHSEIFLELLEQEARNKGVGRIETTSVSPPRMVSALKRCGYLLNKDDCYYKDI